MRRRWQPRPSLLRGNQGGKALKWLPAHFNFERKIRLPCRECVHKFRIFCPEVRRGTRAFIYPCLLMKPVLRLRLHATQSQPCFLAASNALAIPVGNRIFAATPTERITHYTLQAKSCAKGCPFGNPGQQNRLNIPHFPGAWYSAFICCQQPPFRGLRVVPCKLT